MGGLAPDELTPEEWMSLGDILHRDFDIKPGFTILRTREVRHATVFAPVFRDDYTVAYNEDDVNLTSYRTTDKELVAGYSEKLNIVVIGKVWHLGERTHSRQ